MRDPSIALSWTELLDPDSPWALLAIGPESSLDGFAGECLAGTECRIVRGGNCRDSVQLFREWAAALQFPYYFGHNWDAFEECIRDLDWLCAQRLFIFVSHVDEVLASEPERYVTLMDILGSAVNDRQAQRGRVEDRPELVRVILHADALNSVQERLTASPSPVAVRYLAEDARSGDQRDSQSEGAELE
jgi:hypothetical protein